MADVNSPDNDQVTRQALQHLKSLQNAGVEFVGRRDLAPIPIPAPEGSGGGQLLSLFEEPTATPAAAAPPAGPAELTVEQRRHSLDLLAEQVSTCPRCPELASTRKQTVFGDGPPGAEICFIGEAPGKDEDDQGLPFVGAAGQLLNRIIVACGLKREEVYICNILKCRPPNNRTPLASEAANCRSYLERQLELVAPKYIVALGGTAAQNLLGVTMSMAKLRGRFHDYRGIPVLCTYHPAFLLPHRSPEKKKEVWEDMKMLLARMGRPVPGK
jgi:DNA polymerase